MNYYDLGYSKFLTKPILTGGSPVESNGDSSVGSISSSDLSVQLNPVTDIVFSSTDSNTCAWTAGTIYFSNGSNSGNLVAGNTGNITAKTYVYFDGDKPAQLLMDTDIKNVFGGRKMLLAIVEEGATGKSCKITPIITTGYTGNIVAENINVTQLDAVAANTGTLTVDESITAGGSANGIIYVKDSSNVTKVQLDNTGITVNSGKITIQNDSNTTTIDSKGVVSGQNFTITDSVTSVTDQQITSTSQTDVTNATLTLVLARSALVLITFFSNMGLHTTSISTCDQFLVNLYSNLDGGAFTYRKDIRLMFTTTGDETMYTLSNSFLGTFSAGTNIFKLSANLYNIAENPYGKIYFSGISYVVLGK